MVYLVGVTDIQLYLIWIIPQFFIGFLPKLVKRFTLMSPFSSIGVCIHINVQFCKPEILVSHISKMAGAVFYKFGIKTPWPQICNQIRVHRSTKVWKSHTFFTHHGVVRGLLGLQNMHTAMCLVIKFNFVHNFSQLCNYILIYHVSYHFKIA